MIHFIVRVENYRERDPQWSNNGTHALQIYVGMFLMRTDFKKYFWLYIYDTFNIRSEGSCICISKLDVSHSFVS
jgi:hypothetical protein